MSGHYTVITDSVITVFVSSNVNTFGSERRFSKTLTIGDLKNKLELLTGGSAESMQLQLFNRDDIFIIALDDDNAFLGFYPIDNGMRIHVRHLCLVIDKSLQFGEYEDVSKVKKFEMSDETYSKREDSLRTFKQKHKLGQFNEEEKALKLQEKEIQEQKELELSSNIHLGNRCEVRAPNQPTKRGTVMYVGTTDFKPGIWIGVKYDEPLGKNDGSVNGKTYFECEENYGGFVKPQHVVIGDFPEEDYGMVDDEM